MLVGSVRTGVTVINTHHLVPRRLVEVLLLDIRGITINPFYLSRIAHHSPGLILRFTPYVRIQSFASIATLLRSHPEQERNVVRLLLNNLVCLPLSCP